MIAPPKMPARLSLPDRTAITARILMEARGQPYRYGSNDCFFLGLRQIDAICGTAHVEAFLGAYATLRGAHRAMRKRGHGSIVTLYEELVPKIPWGRARTGDVAVILLDDGEHVGIHAGQSWMSITEHGNRSWPIHLAIAAFGV